MSSENRILRLAGTEEQGLHESEERERERERREENGDREGLREREFIICIKFLEVEITCNEVF